MDEYPVYLNRPWVNHSTNDFSGWTITVTAVNGALIVSALALIVRIAGEALWTILAFALHQSRATQSLSTALFRQTQILLRNPTDSITSSYELAKIGSKWRGKVNGAMRKTYGLALWPFLIFVTFTVAGIFVAKVTIPAYESNQILLRSNNCGMQDFETVIPDKALRLQAKQLSDVRRARAYAGECYNVTGGGIGCSTLPVQQIPYTMDINATDPNKGRNVASSVTLDTGVLDSHKHLGINARKSVIE